MTSKDGTAIAFDRSGEGAPVVLVGGALSTRGAAEPLAGLLAPSFTVYAYDRRGRGDSGETPPYAVEREVEDIQALAEDAGGSAFAFGHSSGGVLALEAAARTLGITELALYEPPFIIDTSRSPVPDDYVEHLADLASTDRRSDAVEFFMLTGVGVPPEAIAPMKELPFWPALEAVAHTLSYDGQIMGDNLTGERLQAGRWASVTIPTLVIDGGASPPWLGNAAQALVDVLPDARRRTIEGQTHDVDAALLAPVLEEFFAGLTDFEEAQVDARDDLAAVARGIIDGNRYMVLGTSDAEGRPWVSPVYYAPSGYAELYWVSSPEANHSRNLDGRPELSIVVFDSRVAVGEGQGVYMSALAEELTGADLERGIEIFSGVSESHGAKPWTLDDVRPPEPYRLYRARVSEHSVLDPDSHPNQRTPVQP